MIDVPIYVDKALVSFDTAKEIVAATGRRVVAVHKDAVKALNLQAQNDIMHRMLTDILAYPNPEEPLTDDKVRLNDWIRQGLERCKLLQPHAIGAWTGDKNSEGGEVQSELAVPLPPSPSL